MTDEVTQVQADVEVSIWVSDSAPADVYTRCQDAEWQQQFYGDRVVTPEQVRNHWTFNCIANGVLDVERLDGWADIPPGVVTMRVTQVDAA